MDETNALNEARKLVEKGWCKGTSARNAAGEPTGTTDVDAVAWCPYGAMGAIPGASFIRTTDRYRKSIGRLAISKWNDEPERTKEEVLAAFDRAIESVEP
ncbi:hypothetical protein EP7_004300 [Isosphaeraceae bacterium EP7]